MKKALLFAIIVALGMFQATLLNYFRIFLVKPDLLLISMVIISLSGTPVFLAISFSLVAGMLKDIFSLNPSSVNTILFPLWSYLIIRLSKKISIDTNLTRAFFLFTIVIVNDLVAFSLSLPTVSPVSSGIFCKILILSPLYAALVSPLLFKLLRPLF